MTVPAAVPKEDLDALLKVYTDNPSTLLSALHIKAFTRLQHLEQLAERMTGALKDADRAYVNLLENARDRIVFFGGTCDPVDVMERGDPYLIQLRSLIASLGEGP
jgi:hypothetical protein